MPRFTLMWGDVEDPGFGPDLLRNARFIQAGLDQCTRRIPSGVYGNEGSLQRIVGDYPFPNYPYFRASDDGVPDVNNVPTNGMNVAYEQFALDRDWNGHKVDIVVRRDAQGNAEYGIDISNWTGVPVAQWFIDLWNDANIPIRFVIFGDQMPYVTRAQVANCEASGLPFEFQLYTYFNAEGGEYYSGRDGAQQVDDALDQMGVPEAQDVTQPSNASAPPSEAPVHADDVPLIAIRTELRLALSSIDGASTQVGEALRLAGG